MAMVLHVHKEISFHPQGSIFVQASSQLHSSQEILDGCVIGRIDSAEVQSHLIAASSSRWTTVPFWIQIVSEFQEIQKRCCCFSRCWLDCLPLACVFVLVMEICFGGV